MNKQLVASDFQFFQHPNIGQLLEVDRGGVRVIYTVRLFSGALVLLTIYSKSTQENIPAHVLRKIAAEMGHATS